MPDSDFHGKFSEEYDSLVDEYQSFGDQAVFGIMYDFISPGQKVLDIGIGTGLGSRRLHHHGLDIYGIDISPDMLDQCRRKGFARELKVADVISDPIPYDDDFFDHVISLGVFHFFDDLTPVFEESHRVLKSGGTFTFTVMSDEKGGPEGIGITRRMTKWGKEVNILGRGYVEDLSKRSGFNPLVWLLFVASIDPEDGERSYHWAYVLKK